jgi:hypothetical protein
MNSQVYSYNELPTSTNNSLRQYLPLVIRDSGNFYLIETIDKLPFGRPIIIICANANSAMLEMVKKVFQMGVDYGESVKEQQQE